MKAPHPARRTQRGRRQPVRPPVTHPAPHPPSPAAAARYEARARVAKALAHPSRLLMLDALDAGERCVCELTALVGADQSTVSKHLALLKSAGIVADRRDGAKTFYRLRIRCLRGFWDCVEAVLRENIRQQQAAIAP